MKKFLSDFITTLSTRRQVRVGALLEDARVDKERLDTLAAILSERYGQFAPMRYLQETEGGQILAGPIILNFRDTIVRISDLYSASNLISLLLESHAAVLSSEVKSAEDELVALEKQAANYAFLLSDGKAFDYAYLEPFSDESGREIGLNFSISDRAGLNFGPAENAAIVPEEGVLAIPQQIRPHGLTASILKGNASAYLENDTPFEHVYTPESATGWVATARTPGPVSAPIAEAKGRSGVQLMLEFTLTQPAPASQIRLVPLAYQPVELVRATLYPTMDTETGIELLSEDEIRVLDRPHTLHFPLQTMARVRILINQPIYERRSVMANQAESEARIMLEEVRQRRTISKGALRRFSRQAAEKNRRYEAAYMVQTLGADEDRLADRMYQTGIPRGDSPDGVMQPGFMQQVLSRFGGDRSAWTRSSGTADVFYRIGLRRIAELSQLTRRTPDGADAAVLPVMSTPTPPPEPPAGNDYWYRIGLSSVSIGVNAPGFKGVYLSKPLDATGDIGEVRLKAADRNYSLPVSGRQLSQVTSVEYSVTNRSNPKDESAWLPILPTNATEVVGERFFPDVAGRGYLRFLADPLRTLHLYQNGMEMKLQPQMYLYATSGRVSGLTLPEMQYGKDDVFTVSYTPVGDPTTVSFESTGYATNIPLVAAYDEQGAGEGYASTVGRGEVDLQHVPYINSQEVLASTYGTLGLTPYQPIVVRLSSGATAINLTNYQGGVQFPLPSADEGYYYLNSGRALIFNQKVENFRVFYQYLQNTVRFRVVLRVNDKDFVSPTVDYVHLKAKTRRPNTTAIL